jgi:hypothetical protein
MEMPCFTKTQQIDGTVDRTTTNDYSMAKRVIAGNPFPTLMTGMTNTLNYKGIDFSFQENGALAYTIQQESTNPAADYFDNQTVDQLNRWQNPEISQMCRKHGCMEVMEPVHQPVFLNRFY